MTFSFEKLHKNHKFAFLDGLLFGVVITLVGIAIYQGQKESEKLYPIYTVGAPQRD